MLDLRASRYRQLVIQRGNVLISFLRSVVHLPGGTGLNESDIGHSDKPENFTQVRLQRVEPFGRRSWTRRDVLPGIGNILVVWIRGLFLGERELEYATRHANPNRVLGFADPTCIFVDRLSLVLCMLASDDHQVRYR